MTSHHQSLKKRYNLMRKLITKYGKEYAMNTPSRFAVSFLTHFFPMHPFSTPDNIKKPYGFLMFSGGQRKGALGANGLRLLVLSSLLDLVTETTASVHLSRCYIHEIQTAGRPKNKVPVVGYLKDAADVTFVMSCDIQKFKEVYFRKI